MTCCACSRPIILSEAETTLLTAAANAPDRVVMAAGEDWRAVARVLVRMGYLERLGRGRYKATERGISRLTDSSFCQAAAAAA